MRFPPFRRSQRPEIQEIHKGFGNGFRKRSGLYKIDNFWAFVKFPSISAVPKAAQGGLYKIDNFRAFVKFPPVPEAENQSSDRIRDISSRCLHLPPCDLPALPTLRTYRHDRPESANDADTAIARCTSVRASRACLAGGKCKATTSVDRLVADTTAKQLRYLLAQMENFLGSYNSAAFIV